MISNQAKAQAQTTCCTAPAPQTTTPVSFWSRLCRRWRHLDMPLLVIALIVVSIALFIPTQLTVTLRFTWDALLHIAPWIGVSVALAAYAQASQADKLIALAFSGHPVRMVLLAAILGAVTPFCSCGVVPLIAGLLAAGVPFAPIMAFWISSPLMDPTMFVMTAASLGMEFAVVKTLASIAMALFAGGVTHSLVKRGFVTDLLRTAPALSCCGTRSSNHPTVLWSIWKSPTTRQIFIDSVFGNTWFLGRWMVLAFLLESLMVVYVPGENVTAWLGQGTSAIPLAVAIGIPSYLNGYAALPLVSGLMSLGMNPAVALAFLVAGGVTSLPAMAAVWGLVKPRAFALYLGLALTSSLGVAYAYALFLNLQNVL